MMLQNPETKVRSRKQSSSIVDYLKSIGQSASFADRKKKAQELGIENYTGTAQQNSKLLQKLRSPDPISASQEESKNILDRSEQDILDQNREYVTDGTLRSSSWKRYMDYINWLKRQSKPKDGASQFEDNVTGVLPERYMNFGQWQKYEENNPAGRSFKILKGSRNPAGPGYKSAVPKVLSIEIDPFEE
jgi:hypothetical protein